MTYRPNRPPTPKEWKNSYPLYYVDPFPSEWTYAGVIIGADRWGEAPVALFWRIPNFSGDDRESYESIAGFTPAKIQECLEELEKIREYLSGAEDGLERLDDVLIAQNFLFAEIAKHAV